MLLEFKVYQLKEDSRMYSQVMESKNKLNEFIVVGEEILGKKSIKQLDCYKAIQQEENGIKLLGGLKIDEAAYTIEKKDLILKSGFGVETSEMEIPREYLTMRIIENIQRLNTI